MAAETKARARAFRMEMKMAGGVGRNTFMDHGVQLLEDAEEEAAEDAEAAAAAEPHAHGGDEPAGGLGGAPLVCCRGRARPSRA